MLTYCVQSPFIFLFRAARCWCTTVYFSRRENRATSNELGESLGPVARNWSRAFKMHCEAEAHRNYRESVSRILRALARHVRGPRRLSDYFNAAICMRWGSGKWRVRAWPTSYDRSDSSHPANGRYSPSADDYLILQCWTHRRGLTALIMNRVDYENRINFARAY